MPMIGSFYAPGEWVQPNQRNIGDSLLDLYKMKRQIEADRMVREEARMELENKRLERATKLENAKMEREGQKKLADLLTPKPVVTGNLTDKYRKGMGTAADVANAAMKAAGAFTGAALPSAQASFPAQGLSQATASRAQQDAEVDFENPELIGKLMQIAASTPSMRPVLDEIVKASITKKAQKNNRTFEEELALIEAKKGSNLAVQDAITARATQLMERKAEITKALQEGRFTQEGALMAQKYMLALDAELATIRERARVTPPTPGTYAQGVGYRTPRYDQNGQVVGWDIAPFGISGQPAPAPQTPAQQAPFSPGQVASGQAGIAPSDKVAKMAGPEAPGMMNIPGTGADANLDVGAATGAAPLATATPDLAAEEKWPVQPAAKPAGASKYTPEQTAAMALTKEQNNFRGRKFVRSMDTALFQMNKLNARYKEYLQKGGVKSIQELTTLFEYIKGLDDSVVRESEISLFKRGQDWLTDWGNTISRFRGSPEQVRIMGDQFMREIVRESRMGFQERINTYETLRKDEMAAKAPIFKSFNQNPEDYYKPLSPLYLAAARGGVLPSETLAADLAKKPIPSAEELPEGYSNPRWELNEKGVPVLTLLKNDTGKRRPIQWPVAQEAK